jgi:hypothetical protein
LIIFINDLTLGFSGEQMVIKLVLLTAIILSFTPAATARSKTDSNARVGASASPRSLSRMRTIQQLANAVSDAFNAGTLASLDAGRPYVGPIKVVIENLIDVERKTFRTLAAVERWLKSRETKDGPITNPRRNSGSLRQCRNGICTFEPAGGLHNILYLKKITYGMRKGQPYIKTIHLVND